MNNIKYKLTIEFSEYAGNFNRELNAFVFGYSDDDPHDWVQALYDDCEKAMKETDLEDELFSFYDYFNDEYGQTISELDDKKVTIHFAEDPRRFLYFFKTRLLLFPQALAHCWKFAPKKVKVIRATLIKEVTTQCEIYRDEF